MDPTTAIPVHFTLQALSIAAAGLLLAWSLVRRRWFGAVGAAVLGVGEGLHAARLIDTDDDPVLLVLRLVGVLLLSVAAIGLPAWPVFAAGAAAFVGGTAWASVVGGGIADPTPGPHLLLGVGSLVFAVWSWRVSRDTVRLRVLTALIAMLAIAVVMGGGAVSRVAALDKRNEQLRQLGSAASAATADFAEAVNGLSRRAALLSPLLAADLEAPGEPDAVRTALAGPNEAILVADRRGPRAYVAGGNVSTYTADQAFAAPAARIALGGTPSSAFDVTGGRLIISAAAPIYRPGTQRDVVGVVALIRTRTPAVLRTAARVYAPDAEIVLLDRQVAASDRDLLSIQPARAGDDVVFERVPTPSGTRPVATTGIPTSDVRLAVVGSDEGTVQAATGLLRALLLAILAAAMLAVVVALWLSARVTRPILDLAAGAEQVKADFLASVSHELRTPLTPIRGYTELLRRGRIPARHRADYLDEIGEAASRLERIVTLLLDVAALEAGRFPIAADEVRPNELLADVAERWGPRTRHTFRIEAPASVPRIRGDRDALARVLDELVDNAVKFSPDGETIVLRARRARAGVEMSVTDEGIGVADDAAEELTRAFAQASSGDRRRFGGLGLGLTFVSGVLAAHNSRLALQSSADGSTFSFTLPTAGMVSRMPARTARSASEPDASS